MNKPVTEFLHKHSMRLAVTAAMLIAVMAMFTQKLCAEEKMETRLVNVSNVLSYYGFKGGKFSISGDSVVDKLPAVDQIKFGKIEGVKCIDTPEEFITAAYYSQIEVPKSARTKIEKELPRSKEGALRLASMWMKKAAIFPENAAAYSKAIEIIKQKSNVTDTEIRAYYAAAIEKEVLLLGKKYLGKWYKTEEERRALLQPIIDYMLHPTNDGLRKINAFHRSLTNDRNKYFGYTKIIDELDKGLGDKVFYIEN